MKAFKLKYSFPLLFLSLLFSTTLQLNAVSVGVIGFSQRPINSLNSVTINGAILQIGNQLICRNGNNSDGSNGADGNTCLAPTLGTPNNSWRQYRFQADTSPSAPFNSMAKLVMLPGDEVVSARLYWSARANDSTDASSNAAGQIQIKGPLATAYTTLTALPGDHGNDGIDYGASVDVTAYVTNNMSGNYHVGGIVSQSGTSGIYASWQLLIVVKNSARSLKNIAIYDGFDSIYDTAITTTATNFITPTGTKPFNANLFVYSGETDDSYGDSTEIQDGTGAWNFLIDGQNDPNDVMNASVSSPDYPGGYRSNDTTMANPNFQNVLGVDIDKLVINDKLDSSKQILSNSQTSTQIKLSSFKGSYSSADRYSLNMFAFETEVFVPEFCYDYAYKQQGKYFTEKNAGNADPRLVGDVVTNESVEVTIYLKSLVDSSITISDMMIHVSDINNTQAKLLGNSVRLATKGSLYPTIPPYSTNTIGEEDFINNIDKGILGENEYFYVYYSLDPQTTDLDMPITVDASYNLNLQSVSVPYTLRLSKEIPLCDDGAYDYSPVTGVFNVVHNNYYNNATQFYNLPTQVTSRAGDFKVITTDAEDNDLLQPKSTIVAVELIDAAAFQTTDASCRELDSAISERVWVTFDENNSQTMFDRASLEASLGLNNLISSAPEFYAQARENTAFRVSYNAIPDTNDSLINHTLLPNGEYLINNFTELVQTIGDCKRPVLYPLGSSENVGTATMVAQACGQASSNNSITKAQYQSCMECLYGYNVRFVCSRDNFAIRPEAFLIKINDQDQANLSNKIRVANTDNISGTTSVDSPTAETELAAGYQYNLEINATNHLTNAASVGYTKVFEVDSTTDLLEYEWSPTSTLTGCNDMNDTPIDFRIVDGSVLNLNSSLNQVGKYVLQMKDETWTTVDNNPTAMSHHIAPYFLSPNSLDCVQNTSDTASETAVTSNASPLNGCYISSNHDGSSPNPLQYRDYPVEFHPYIFDITGIRATVGLAHQDVNASSYIYMSDMSKDENMSYHLNGIIRAAGENNSSLSNFVNNCYAKPLDINLNIASMNLPVAYQYRFHSLDSNKVDISTHNGNLVGGTIINVVTADFPKDKNGSADTIVNLNYNRTNNVEINPEAITFNKYNLNCTNTANCTFNADLSTRDSNGSKDLNSSIAVKHYYGRTHSPRSRFVTNPGNAFIYYEIYCNGTTLNGSKCDKGLLPNSYISKITDDPRWFRNEEHNITSHGDIGIITQKGSSSDVSAGTLNNNTVGRTVAPLTYTPGSKGYPYKATMLNAAPSFLIYGKYDATNTQTQNDFEVEFVNPNGNWAGENNGANTTGDTASSKTNRRSMW